MFEVSSGRAVLGQVVEHRRLVLRLFRREVTSRYRQSILGLAWVFVSPLLAVGVMLALEVSGVVRVEAGVSYSVFVALGITLWGLFSRTVTESMSSLVGAGSLVTRIACPRSALVVSKAMVALVELGIRLPLIWLVMPLFGIPPSPWQLLGVISLLPLFALALSLGMILSVLVAVMRDIQFVTPIMLTTALLLTPVLYVAPEGSLLWRANLYNPLHALISTSRALLLGDATVEPGYVPALGLTLLVSLVALRFFAVAQPRLAERIG